MSPAPASFLRKGSSVLALALLFATLSPLASAESADGSQLVVSLLTFSPGEIYWERFGHNAVLVRDRASGEAWAYNYGLFDFNQERFFLNFARGRMRYRLGAFPLDETLAMYQNEGRSIVEQRLNLTAAQRAGVDRFLRWNAQPANAEYGYDYFRDNCSTRVRDVIDKALDGGLRKALSERPAGITYRSETVRLLWPDHALALGMDLAMGPAGDQPLDQWQAAFIPLQLMNSIRDLRVPDGAGGTQRLVGGEHELLLARMADPPSRTPPLVLKSLIAGWLVAGLLAALWLMRRYAAARWALALVGSVILLVAGLAGVILAAMWAFTEHWGAWRDPMLLLINPLMLALIPYWWRVARGAPGSARWQPLLAAAVALLALATLPLAWFGIGAEQLHWLALFLPIHCALAFPMEYRAPGTPAVA